MLTRASSHHIRERSRKAKIRQDLPVRSSLHCVKGIGEPGAHRRLSHRWGHTWVQSVVHILTQARAPSLGRMGNELMMFFAHSSPLESWPEQQTLRSTNWPSLSSPETRPCTWQVGEAWCFDLGAGTGDLGCKGLSKGQ